MQRRLPNTDIYIDVADFSLTTSPTETNIQMGDRFVVKEDRQGSGNFTQTLKGKYTFSNEITFNDDVVFNDGIKTDTIHSNNESATTIDGIICSLIYTYDLFTSISVAVEGDNTKGVTFWMGYDDSQHNVPHIYLGNKVGQYDTRTWDLANGSIVAENGTYQTSIGSLSIPITWLYTTNIQTTNIQTTNIQTTNISSDQPNISVSKTIIPTNPGPLDIGSVSNKFGHGYFYGIKGCNESLYDPGNSINSLGEQGSMFPLITDSNNTMVRVRCFWDGTQSEWTNGPLHDGIFYIPRGKQIGKKIDGVYGTGYEIEYASGGTLVVYLEMVNGLYNYPSDIPNSLFVFLKTLAFNIPSSTLMPGTSGTLFNSDHNSHVDINIIMLIGTIE